MVLKHIKNRIQIVNFIKKITETMKVISASQFKNYEKLLENSAIYLKTIRYSMCNLYDNDKNFYSIIDNNNNMSLIIIFGSDKSLCGSFNAKIISKLNKVMTPNTKLVCVGTKLYQGLKNIYNSNIISYIPFFSRTNKSVNISQAFDLVKDILDIIHKYKVLSCNIIYHIFSSIMSINVTNDCILPINFTKIRDKNYESYITNFDNNIKFISHIVIKKYLNAFIFNVYCNSIISENTYRMLSMENANRNSNKKLKELRLIYNKSRQSAITKELIEVISGAEGSK